ncbi:transcriptional regulator with XRE-family HTH domain [Kitasatospora sp. MAP12-15]|uniref:helix-turn-helix domain-containing protein n=1 Tax=unclassified Kitasatospora TaxID=2633591 RepID=UPI002473A882|nr:helix-turn-helix transcriptional regulator [Kitasatospora sp. MAP12-44]MDH6111384.1 transcriptional regulator with XRE-family HTH domain [Kitasatospora sp. MAP12-44]
MTTDGWLADLTARIAAEVRKHRNRLGMTGPEVAEACGNLGVPLPSNMIANLESGRRGSLKLEELLVLAKVLEVPPVSLIFPLDDRPTVELLPEMDVPSWEAASWFTGEERLTTAAPAGSPRAALDAFREHQVAVETALLSTEQAVTRRLQAPRARNPEIAAQLIRQAEEFERIASRDYDVLKATRDQLRAQGLRPAPLPDELDFVDDPDDKENATP